MAWRVVQEENLTQREWGVPYSTDPGILVRERGRLKRKVGEINEFTPFIGKGRTRG